jgi:hypothetical protein
VLRAGTGRRHRRREGPVFDSSVLQGAIALVLVYLIFSLFCSAIQEWIARLLALRASGLRQGIDDLLADRTTAALADAFHGHALIEVLKPPRAPLLRSIFGGGEKAKYPSYISAQTFALAVMDLTMTVRPPAPGQGGSASLNTSIKDRSEAAPPAVLKVLLQDVGPDVDAVRQRLAQWFDDSMERVSGWYKRRVQVTLIVIATAVTVLLNVDTIHIAKRLAGEPLLRQALVKQAEAVVEANRGAKPDSLQIVLKDQMAKLEGAGLTFGWGHCSPLATTPAGAACPPAPNKLLGLFLTVIALSLGAPFWFDLLNKLVNLRQTGVPPDERKPAPRNP